jgi:hypothetical protein
MKCHQESKVHINYLALAWHNMAAGEIPLPVGAT